MRMAAFSEKRNGVERRQVFRGLLLALGSTFIAGRARVGRAAPSATPSPSYMETEKVTGIGGFFFRAHDPVALARWYQQHLGITPTPMNYGDPSWQQEAGTTVFSPFPQTTDYFDPNKVWMINFRVADLDKMAAQLRAAGIEIKIDPQTYPNGRFAHLHDPEGNPIELWQPVKPGA